MDLTKLEKDWTEYIQIFKYNDLYWTAAEVVKQTKTSWPQSNQTKYDKFHNAAKWAEIEKQYGVEVLLAAPLGKKHLIVTNGAVLLENTLKETCKNGLSVVNYMDNGKTFSGVYRANLVMKKFMDSEFKAFEGKVYYIDKNMNNPDIDNIDVLDPTLRKQGKAKPQKKSKGAAEDSDKLCY